MIPARLGSKRIKHKNLRLLDGKPLVSHVLDICKDRGIYFGTTPSSTDAAAEWIEKGASFFEMGDEMEFIREGADRLISDIQAAIDNKG